MPTFKNRKTGRSIEISEAERPLLQKMIDSGEIQTVDDYVISRQLQAGQPRTDPAVEKEQIQGFVNALPGLIGGISGPALLGRGIGAAASFLPKVLQKIGTGLSQRVIASGIGGAIGEEVGARFQGREPETKRVIGEQVTGELVGAGLVGLAKKSLGPFAGSAKVEDLPFIKGAREAGITVRPAQVSRSFILQVLDNIAEGAPSSGRIIIESQQAQQSFINRIGGEFAEQFGKKVDPDIAGNVIQGAIQGRADTFQSVISGLYKRVDNEMMRAAREKVAKEGPGAFKPGVAETIETTARDLGTEGIAAGIQPPVSPPVLFTAAGQPMQQSTALSNLIRRIGAGEANAEEIASAGFGVDLRPAKQIALQSLRRRPVSLTPSKTGTDIASQILDEADFVTFSQGAALRSDLLALTRGREGLTSSSLSGRIASSVDNSLEEAGKSLNPEAFQLWRTANALHRNGVEGFRNPFIRGILQKNPEVVARATFKPGNITDIRRLRRAAGAEAFQSYSGPAMDILFKRASDANQNISGKGLLKAINVFGDPTLRESFGHGTLSELKKFARTATILQEGKETNIGKVLVQLKTAGLIVNLARRGQRLVSSTFLIAPRVLAKMFTNPKTAKFLTEGFGIDANTPKGIKFAAKLIDEATRAGAKIAVTGTVEGGRQLLQAGRQKIEETFSEGLPAFSR